MKYTPDTVLSFWFEELSPQQWWEKSRELDQNITERFESLQKAAARCELFSWRETARGRLAEIIILDQFSRNIYRDQAQAFACDSLALALAQTGVTMHADREIEIKQRSFFYMPFMHSESPYIHAVAVKLFDQPGMEASLDFEIKHKDIIDRFGRFPHRNALLGRTSTPEELMFLTTPGSSF